MVMQMVNGLATQNRHFQTQVTDLATRLEKLEAQLATVPKEEKASVTPLAHGAATPPAEGVPPIHLSNMGVPEDRTAMMVESGTDFEAYSPRSDAGDEGNARGSKFPKLASTAEQEKGLEGRERSPRRSNKEDRQSSAAAASS